MPASMPAVVVLIVCKTVMSGPEDQNSQYTGWENRDWAYENSMMTCHRHEIQMFDPAEAQGSDPVPFNSMSCMSAAIRLATQWDLEHRASAYRTWRVACPVPIMNTGSDGIEGTPDDQVVGYKLPECGHPDTVVCETDSQI